MEQSGRKGRSRTPRRTRTDRDWMMMVIGVLLIVLFIAAGYAALKGRDARHKKRGPVKDPKAAMVIDGRRSLMNEASSPAIGPCSKLVCRAARQSTLEMTPGTGRVKENPADGLIG